MIRHILSALLCAAALLCLPLEPTAHDSPVDHVDRAIRIYFENGKLFVRYQLQLSERSATMQLAQLDTNQDGMISDAERGTFFAAQQKELSALLKLKLGENALELKPEGTVELLPQFKQVFLFSAPAGKLEKGRFKGELLDLYSRNYPGAYRWDEPKRKVEGPSVQVSEAPKFHTVDGHPSVLLIRFELQIP